jgi:DNA ligase-associated metallophosphoesterase
VFLPQHGSLLVADTHFGKPSVFARSGIPVPHGVTSATLGRIERMLEATAAARLVVLGDLWHGRLTADDPCLHDLRRWRHGHRALDVHVIRGNHDRHAREEQLVEARYHDRFLEFGSLRLQHVPEVRSDGLVVAGHLHPVVRLRDVGRTAARLPCFHLQARLLTLPAVGEFTGGHRIHPVAGDRVFVCASGQVIEAPLVGSPP